jgi:hypothetical protein
VKHFVTALAFVLAAVVVSAADVSGTWNVSGDVMNNPVVFVCKLAQAGDTLSGTATFENGKAAPVKGSVKDNTLTFEFDVDHEGQTYTNVFTGTLKDAGLIEGSIAVGGVEGSFTAKKQ